MKLTYRHTRNACFTGYVTQAIVNNLCPLLFLTFQQQFSITLSQISLKTMWPVYLAGIPVNAMQGLCTVIVMLLFGKPFLEKLDRVKLKYGMMEDDLGV